MAMWKEYNVIVNHDDNMFIGRTEMGDHYHTNDLVKAIRFANHTVLKEYISRFPEHNWKPLHVKIKPTRKVK